MNTENLVSDFSKQLDLSGQPLNAGDLKQPDSVLDDLFS